MILGSFFKSANVQFVPTRGLLKGAPLISSTRTRESTAGHLH